MVEKHGRTPAGNDEKPDGQPARDALIAFSMHVGSLKKQPDRQASIASALRTVATEKAGVEALAAALQNGLSAPFAHADRTHLRHHRPGHRHRRRQERAYRLEDRRDAGLDRNPRFLRASRGSQSRRSRHDRARRRHHRHVVVGRKPGIEGHHRLFAALLDPVDRDHVGRDIGAGASRQTWCCSCRARRRPARTGLRRPRPRCCNW